MFKHILIPTINFILLLVVFCGPLSAEDLYKKYQPNSTSRIRENIEWSTTYSFNVNDKTKPRVLLIGDSICNGYYRAVQDEFHGKMNITFWATSKCVTDRDYFRELDLILSGYQYDVISFNNGLHSLDTDRSEWTIAYRGAIEFILAKCPKAILFITNNTPLKDPVLTIKSKELNGIVEKIATDHKIQIIDLFHQMDPLDRNQFWSDTFHFKAPAIKIQAQYIANILLKAVQ